MVRELPVSRNPNSQRFWLVFMRKRFQDCWPAQVYAALLDEGRFHCSIRTMYRLLEARGERISELQKYIA
jgi:hypothetical protein